MIGLLIIPQLQFGDLPGSVHGPLAEFHVGGGSQQLPGLIKDAEPIGHGIGVPTVPGLSLPVELDVDPLIPIPPVALGQNVVHSGGGDHRADGLSQHTLPVPAQKIAVILVDLGDDAVFVHHDEAVLRLIQELLKDQAAAVILRHGRHILSVWEQHSTAASILQAGCGKNDTHKRE